MTDHLVSTGDSTESLRRIVDGIVRRQDAMDVRFVALESLLAHSQATSIAPASPIAPIAATGPFAPASPITPFAPASPITPFAPASPITPITPITPMPPLAPPSPIASIAPASPITPTSTTTPPVAVPASPAAMTSPMPPLAPAPPRGSLAALRPTAPARVAPALRARSLAASVPNAAAPNLESRVGLAWLNRIGVITLILGAAFAFKTAVDHDWLGPVARILVGLGVATAALVGGDLVWKRARHVVFAQGLTGLGVALLYVSFGAAFVLYRLVPQGGAFALMAGTTTLTALLAIRYRSEAIAWLAMFGGYVTPIVLSTGDANGLAFLTYLAILNVGCVALARRQTWPRLEYLAAIATVSLYAGWWSVAASAAADTHVATIFAVVFYAQLAIARPRLLWYAGQVLGPCMVAHLYWGDLPVMVSVLLVFALGGALVGAARRWTAAPLWTLAWFWLPIMLQLADHFGLAGFDPAPGLVFVELTAAFALFLGWTIWTHVRDRRRFTGFELASLITSPCAYFVVALAVLAGHASLAALGAFALALAAVHAVLARLVWHPDRSLARDPLPGKIALGIALALVTIAAPLELGGFALAIAWTAEATLLAYLARRYAAAQLGHAAIAAFVLAVAAAVVVISDHYALLALGAPHRTLVANPQLATLLAIAAGLVVASRWLRERALAVLAYLGAHALAIAAIALEIDAWAGGRAEGHAAYLETATVAISIELAIYAACLVVLGLARRSLVDRVAGLVLMSLVIVKLYLSDVWMLGTGFRVAAFLGLGVLLLAVSFLYSRYRSVVERLWK